MRRIFDAAMDLSPGDRRGFLAGECGGDDGLRREVEELLRLGGQDDAFLRPRGGEPHFDIHDDRADPLIGRVIGAYALESVIARGGMGTVYLAAQEKPRRKVAVKVMRTGLWSGSAERRFEYESHILGRLQHPNIAQVYEAGVGEVAVDSSSAGTADATRTRTLRVQYFAMEHVAGGIAITQFANAQKLDTRGRLELFLQACDGVHHGHQKGVVHRDLKPGNILVDESGRVKLIDFGVARCTDADVTLTSMHTDVGHLIGTLAYMSPEQCEGDTANIDTRSDVYSLGVVLYELLCGKLPYEISTRSIPRATRTICEELPARPSTIDRKLRGDLELLVLKALEKNAKQRYTSVEAVAGDIRRYLRGEPIEARRPTVWTRGLKWAARRPKAATALLCGLIVVVVFFATWLSISIANSITHNLIVISSTNQRFPEKADTSYQYDYASLIALSGRTLHTWSSGTASIIFADLVDRPAKWGGGKVVVIAFQRNAETPLRGQLCVFDANGPYDNPLWRGAVEQGVVDRMPPDAWPRPQSDPNRQYVASEFAITCGAVVDVFPGQDHPGKEIITYQMHDPGSQGVLRIFNLNGEVLFQVWQDGGIDDLQWMANAGLLVCEAIKGDKYPHDYEPALKLPQPVVLFAIRPEPGRITRAWINPHEPDWGEADWFKCEWYKAFCIPYVSGASGFGAWIALERGNSGGERLFVMAELLHVITPSGLLYNFGVEIDAKGENLIGRPLNDCAEQTWQRDRMLPNPAERPEDFQLLDWNEINPPCGMK